MFSKQHELKLCVTKKDVLLDPLHVPFAPTFRQSPELNWLITLTKNTLKQLLVLLINAKYVTNTSIASIFCENKAERTWNTKSFKCSKCWCYTTKWKMLMTTAWKRNWKLAINFGGQWDEEWETQRLLFCHGYSRPDISVAKAGCCVWQSEMCS